MSFAHILTPLDVGFLLPFEFTPGFSIARADRDQIAEIKPYLHGGIFHKLLPYELGNFRAEGSMRRFSALPESEWKYLVIDFDSPRSDVSSMGFALQLIAPAVELGLIYFKEGPLNGGLLGGVAPISSFLELHGLKPPVVVTQASIQAAATYFEQIKASQGSAVFKAIVSFDQLRSLPRLSDMSVLGCFAVLESLITHDPLSPTHGDSLNHQVSTKMPLLCKRYNAGPVPATDFQNIDSGKLWKELYKWRSRIAHGGTADFKTGDLKKLGSRDAAFSFLKENVRRLLLLALTEPELINDLKNC